MGAGSGARRGCGRRSRRTTTTGLPPSCSSELAAPSSPGPTFTNFRKSSQAERGRKRFPSGLKRLAVLLQLPGSDLTAVVFPVEAERADTEDLAVLDIHHPFGAAAVKA